MGADAAPPPGSFAADELACVRGGRVVFEALSFRLEPGDALVLRGPNGSGKSTLLRLLAGFLRPSAGALAWDGETVAADALEHRARLHFVGHADPLKPLLTVAENLAFAAGLVGGQGTIERALAGFGLEALAATPARFLSSGQKRRANLARLLAGARPLWLLDEPGVGLDTANRARLEAAIAAHRAGGGMCLLATHGDVAVRDAYVLDFAG
ncbi:MAG: heme ABC exporter ATP-binding protein CcmA [Geminicoccaceae bacterium]